LPIKSDNPKNMFPVFVPHSSKTIASIFDSNMSTDPSGK